MRYSRRRHANGLGHEALLATEQFDGLLFGKPLRRLRAGIVHDTHISMLNLIGASMLNGDSMLELSPLNVAGMKETLGERVRRLREERGLTQPQLVARIPGMSASALSQLENGLSKGVRPNNLIGLARELDVTPEELVEGREDENRAPKAMMKRRREAPIRRVPIIGYAIASPDRDGYFDDMGFPSGAGESYVEFATKDPNAYALWVKGDSMKPRIRPGEVVVVQPNVRVSPGDDVLVKTHKGRKMIKRLLYQRAGEVALGSLNENFKELTLPLDDVEAIHHLTGPVPREAHVEEPPQ